MRKKRKKRERLILIILILLLLIFSPPALALWKSFAFLGNIFLQEEYKPLKSIEIQKIEVSYKSGERDFIADIYLPNKESKKAVVIYVPLARGTRGDPTLINLAETFAKLNVLAFVPFEKEKIIGLIDEEDIEDAVSAFLFLQNFTDAEKIGFFGISYGVGPVIAASADERIKDDVAFIFSLGGYYDLKNLIEFAFTGRFEYGGIKEKFEPDSYTKEVLQTSLTELTEFVAEEETFEEFFAELPAEVKEKIERLSPKNYVRKLNPDTKIFIIHSPTDTLVPYTESLRLYDSLSEEQKKQTKIGIMDTFGHAVPQKLTLQTLFSTYIPNLGKFLPIIYSFMLI